MFTLILPTDREKAIRPSLGFLGGSAGERKRAARPRSRIGLGAAALDRVAFGAPAQHPAGQVGDILEAGLLQDVRRLGRAAAGPAYRDDRPVAREFAGALRQVPKRDQDRVPDVAKRPGEFLGLAHMEALHPRGVLLHPARIYLTHTAVAMAQCPPTGRRQ